eukprot:Clim_evm63s172 gene=Clim_evmTU63s172
MFGADRGNPEEDIVRTDNPKFCCTKLPKHWRCNKSFPTPFQVYSTAPIPDDTKVEIVAYNDTCPSATVKNNVSTFQDNVAAFHDFRILGRSGRGKSLDIKLKIGREEAVIKNAIKITADGPREPRKRRQVDRMERRLSGFGQMDEHGMVHGGMTEDSMMASDHFRMGSLPYQDRSRMGHMKGPVKGDHIDALDIYGAFAMPQAGFSTADRRRNFKSAMSMPAGSEAFQTQLNAADPLGGLGNRADSGLDFNGNAMNAEESKTSGTNSGLDDILGSASTGAARPESASPPRPTMKPVLNRGISIPHGMPINEPVLAPESIQMAAIFPNQGPVGQQVTVIVSGAPLALLIVDSALAGGIVINSNVVHCDNVTVRPNGIVSFQVNMPEKESYITGDSVKVSAFLRRGNQLMQTVNSMNFTYLSQAQMEEKAKATPQEDVMGSPKLDENGIDIKTMHTVMLRLHLKHQQAQIKHLGTNQNVQNRLSHIRNFESKLYMRSAPALTELGRMKTLPAIDANTAKERSLGLTALHISAEFGWTKFAEHLVNAGADVNQKDSLGNSALDWAFMSDQQEVYHLLAGRGAQHNTFASEMDDLGYSLGGMHVQRGLPDDANPQGPAQAVSSGQIPFELQQALYEDVMPESSPPLETGSN